ncbi:MAG: NTP transferase domain-containing protein [Halanaerobiales bacterium]|nr:NTP transferase domain-containing protein [Halanaerobiales bacterium]
MKAIIMAGGQGARLRPLTCNLPKPMVPILNKPVMEYSIELLKDHGITEIGVTTYYLPEMIRDYFGDGSRWGVKLQYFLEEEPLGTAGSVRNATEFLDESFIVVSGDALTDINLTDAIRYHNSKGGLVTLVLSQQPVPLEYGVVMIDENGEINRFLEKPSWGEVFSDLVNTGIYIMEPTIFNYFERGVKFDFSKDLFPLLMQNGEVLYGYPTDRYWSDIGDVEQYIRTQFDILNGKADVYVCGRQIDEGIWVGENTEIPGDVYLNSPVYIGEDVVLKPNTYLEAAVVGDHTIIESGSSLKRSILWSGVYLGKNAEVRAGILCDGVKTKDNIRIFEGASLGKDSTVGRNVTIQAEVKIWPRKKVEDYTNLNRSLVWEEKWRKRIFNTYGVHGLSNIEMTPEFVAKLAASYGSTFNKSVEIAISSDNFSISRMLQKAAVSGLLSSGQKVVDLGEIPSPVARYSIAAIDAEGGLHIRCCYDNPEEVIIEFIDGNGINIDRTMEREIEKKFFNEDFKRADQELIGEYYYAPQMVESYLQGLLSLLNRDQIRRQRYHLVMDYELESLAPIIPVLLERLGCDVDSTYNYGRGMRPLSYAERLATSNRMGNMIQDLNSNLGAILDHNGENLTLITETGRVVTDEEFQILIAMILLNQGLRKLVVPVNAPAYIDNLVNEYGGEVIRTRSDRPTVMRGFYEETVVNGKPFFYPYSDAAVSLGLVLDFMADQEMTLEGIIQTIPEFYTNLEDVNCPWEEKGRVMRRLIESTKNEKVELVEGVKVYHDHGWTLVYPDIDEPVFHVYTEADDPGIASEISHEYASKIEDYLMS